MTGGLPVIIAAAGRGTRFLPSTKVTPKELLPLFDRPVIHYLLDEVAAAGLTEVVIVARPDTVRPLSEYLARDPEWDRFLAGQGKEELLRPLYSLLDALHLSIVPQPPDLPYGSATPLLAVSSHSVAHRLLAGPCVFLYADDVILDAEPGQSLRALLDTYQAAGAAAVVGACRVPRDQISQFGSVAYHPEGQWRVRHIVEKPQPDEAPSDYTPIGRMVLGPAILPVLERQQRELAPGRELWMTEAVSTLADRAPVLAPPIAGRWLTTGDPAHLLEAALALASAPPRGRGRFDGSPLV